VKLAEVKAVFSMGSLAFEGDLPASLFHLGLVAGRRGGLGCELGCRGRVPYQRRARHIAPRGLQRDRNISTGNPYRQLVADLVARGVGVELCRATAKTHHWGNEDLLPDILVNTHAMARTIQLVQEGYIKVSES
jgi:hypothetical protein